jgi:hypothetical protein
MTWELLCWDCCPWFWAPLTAPFGPIDCMVVSVVVRERTDGAGDEKVLSPSLLESKLPFAVRLVPANDEAPCEGAVIDRDAS